jgi:long-chain acyl-CoA synthetase
MAPFRERPGSAGRPVLMISVAVVDESDCPLPTGETGEIVVRGPTVFDGYWNCPDDTAATFRYGWHHTGDNGAFDSDGYLWYRGRSAAKELIKPGGENVYPAEVEAALKAHAAVAEAIVFGVPDREWGESIKAVCVLHTSALAAPDEILAFVASRIARYKRPKHLVLAPDLPRLEDGRIDRAKTRALFS